MVRTDSSNSTSLSGVRAPIAPASTVNLRDLMAHAHRIAKKARPFVASYAEALRHGLKAAWAMLATRREFAAVRARVALRTLTAEQRAASERATRRCGSSYAPF
jgi:hypothetical protein